MIEPSRRKFFQFHLSTAIVMMFVAGALIWANLTPEMDWNDFAQDHGLYLPREVPEIMDFPSAETSISLSSPTWKTTYFGWPLVTMSKREREEILNPFGPATPAQSSFAYFGYAETIIDSTVAVITLLGVWLICEWVIRRRAARK